MHRKEPDEIFFVLKDEQIKIKYLYVTDDNGCKKWKGVHGFLISKKANYFKGLINDAEMCYLVLRLL